MSRQHPRRKRQPMPDIEAMLPAMRKLAAQAAEMLQKLAWQISRHELTLTQAATLSTQWHMNILRKHGQYPSEVRRQQFFQRAMEDLPPMVNAISRGYAPQLTLKIPGIDTIQPTERISYPQVPPCWICAKASNLTTVVNLCKNHTHQPVTIEYPLCDLCASTYESGPKIHADITQQSQDKGYHKSESQNGCIPL